MSRNSRPFQASVVCTNGNFMTPETMFNMFKLSKAVCAERKDLEYKNGVYTRKDFRVMCPIINHLISAAEI